MWPRIGASPLPNPHVGPTRCATTEYLATPAIPRYNGPARAVIVDGSVKAFSADQQTEYRRLVPLRRWSPIRGRRLRWDEVLIGSALMSPAGYRFLVHLAPRIDQLVIPRTNGRLSSAGIDTVGLVTTTGVKSGLPRTQPLALIEDSGGLLAIGS